MNSQFTIAEAALRRISLNISGDTSAQVIAGECLAAMYATSVIDPVAASIDRRAVDALAYAFHVATANGPLYAQQNALDDISRFFNAHCAAQVAQALAHQRIEFLDTIKLYWYRAEKAEAAQALADDDNTQSLCGDIARLTLELEQIKASFKSDLDDAVAEALAAKPAPMADIEITAMALNNGFKLKVQPDGGFALNPYVFDFARELLAARPVTRHAFCPDCGKRQSDVHTCSPAYAIGRDEAHAMVRTGRPTADLIREAFAAGATYRAKVDAAPPTDA